MTTAHYTAFFIEVVKGVGGMVKRLFALLLALVIPAVCMTSCRAPLRSVNELIKAPRYGGGLNEIQQALYSYAGRSVTLKFPKSGDNRAAFTRYDLDGDKVKEAVAFYSVSSTDGMNEVHINIIDKTENGWESVWDVTTGASDIDRIDIAPMSESGTPVIAVGAELYSSTGNQVTLFTYSDGRLITRMQESYTEFLLSDLIGDGYKQLVLLNLNTAERTAWAKVFTADGDGYALLGTAPLDGNISSFGAVSEGTLKGGGKAVFIDSKKSTSSSVTDLVFMDSGKPVNPFYDESAKENTIAPRISADLCRDIDGDGVTDIPFTEVYGGYGDKPVSEQRYLTIWRAFDGKTFTDTLAADYSYDAGYYFEFPESWIGAVTLIYDRNMCSYRLWDNNKNSAADEILRIRTYPVEEFEKMNDSSLIRLAHDSKTVWAARIVMTEGKYAVDKKTVEECFNLL